MRQIRTNISVTFVLLSSLFFALHPVAAQSKREDFRLGAFYFDGWTGKTNHITKNLTDSLLDRKPIWGYITSTPKIMEQQIDLAHDAGISFFNFCWYFSRSPDSTSVSDSPLNNALQLYRNSSNKNKIDFSLLIANHKGFIFERSDWQDLCLYWCSIFKDPSYVTVNGKPLITFFSVKTLTRVFGDERGVNEALDKFRKIAVKSGLNGLTIAACVDPSKESIGVAERSGFDILTGYNYHENGLGRSKDELVSINKMSPQEVKVWNWLVELGHKPIIPVVTVNWDRRGWDKGPVRFSKRFTGYSSSSLENSVRICRKWMGSNRSRVVNENIAYIYAWNEYGEGAWLTPSKMLKNSLLEGLKDGINKNE